jgi:predicted nucleic acid-binding protein
MYNDNTVELIITADGNIINIPFVEELIEAAPQIDSWKFTALKPALAIDNVEIHMDDYVFSSENMFFYNTAKADYPDEICITVVHTDMSDSNNETIIMGSHIFLDNFLGELNYATLIDEIKIIGPEQALDELIPISKLKDYLLWREKEFIEQHQATRYNTKDDNYSVIEMSLQSGARLIATVNTDLLQWQAKPSHPWIAAVEITYHAENDNGMPNNVASELLNTIEEKILAELKDFEGYLYIGRQTGKGLREIYFACSDFRKPSTVLSGIKKHYSGRMEISYEIYKDKYWQTLDRFQPTL